MAPSTFAKPACGTLVEMEEAGILPTVLKRKPEVKLVKTLGLEALGPP